MPKAIDPKDLTRAELENLVLAIREALFPEEDPDAEWDSDTLQTVADLLGLYDLLPPSI